MGFFIRTHIVKIGETMESIAESYGIPNVEILRYFHHQNSPKNSNHIGSEVMVGQEIFIPEQRDIENYFLQRKNIAEKNKENRNFHLQNSNFVPNLKYQNNHYQILITDFSEHKGSENTLEFQGELCYLTQNHIPVLQYHKKNIKVLNGQSDLKLYDLALEISEQMYPVEFSINPENKSLEAVSNSKFLTQQWYKNKEQLLEKYTDSYSLKYIHFVDFTRKNAFIDLLKNDLFLQFLFAPYGNYQDGEMKKELYLGMQPILYHNEMLMEISEHSIEIQQQSESVDRFSSITAKYFLDLHHHLLEEGKVEITSSFYGEMKRIEIEMKKIDS